MLKDKYYHSAREFDTRLLRYGLLPKQDWSSIQQVFIVSTGRTGTKFFSEFFNLFPGHIQSYHEPYPDFLKLAVDYAQGLVEFETALQEIEENRRVFYRDMKRRGIRLYIESNNRFFSLLKPLREVFPNSKVIYIVRDGRDYVRSGMSRVWYKEEDREPRLRADMFASDPYADRWAHMSRFEKIAWRWQKKDGFIYNGFQGLDNAIQVRFEEIFSNPARPGIFQIAQFIGISDDETRGYLEKMGNKKVNTNSKQVIPKWTEWDDDMKRAFDSIAADHMKLHYDYEGMV